MEQQWQILVVDDDPVWLNKLVKILEKADKRYSVLKAATYEKAIQSLESETFQLAVVDVNLADAPVDESGEPGNRRGLDIIKKIRERAPDMSVIIVTGFGTFKVAREAFKERGVLDTIPKQDFDLGEFRSLVSEAIALAHYKKPGENL